jgi:hypothetical protein
MQTNSRQQAHKSTINRQTNDNQQTNNRRQTTTENEQENKMQTNSRHASQQSTDKQTTISRRTTDDKMQTTGTQINRQTNGIAVIVLVIWESWFQGISLSYHVSFQLQHQLLLNPPKKTQTKQYKFQSLNAGCHQSQHIYKRKPGAIALSSWF